RQDLPNAGDGLEPRKGLHVLCFGTARDIEFYFPQELVIVIDEGEIDFNGLADTRIRKMLFDALAVRFVRQLLADLGEIVLTVGILNVGQEFRAFLYQMTATAE